MERSGSQKILRVISIIDIVGGVLMLILGLMTTVAGGLLGGAAGSATLDLVEEGIDPSDVGALSMLTTALAVIVIVEAIISIIEGVLGLRAAKDATKIMPVWILAIITLVASAIGLIMVFVNGTFASDGITSICTLVMDGLMFWIANNIKNEANL